MNAAAVTTTPQLGRPARLASASARRGPKTRVRGLALVGGHHVGARAPSSCGGHWGNCHSGHRKAVAISEFENWNRYYDPSIGRYLQPEPLVQNPKYVRAMAKRGYSVPVYAYALNNPLHFSDPDGRSIRAVLDFLRNYRAMRDANTIGADNYFHCKANCEASSHDDWLDWSDEFDAKFLSELRELTDEYIKRDPPNACNQDRTANRRGQRVPKGVDCKLWCSPYRPPGLAPQY